MANINYFADGSFSLNNGRICLNWVEDTPEDVSIEFYDEDTDSWEAEYFELKDLKEFLDVALSLQEN